ncbi:unnamed protein product [Gongylonema pulchrum]|uniref:Myelin basic protein n=1 Tax=Gongylonema pulchrum TaxID=637853 RepID=A0A183DJ29_9BILA|nr:unnamed protein product [Gongylonema pulchrum]VDK67290.1 unnamed protein product [Gongylonema pulchrum]
MPHASFRISPALQTDNGLDLEEELNSPSEESEDVVSGPREGKPRQKTPPNPDQGLEKRDVEEQGQETGDDLVEVDEGQIHEASDATAEKAVSSGRWPSKVIIKGLGNIRARNPSAKVSSFQ